MATRHSSSLDEKRPHVTRSLSSPSPPEPSTHSTHSETSAISPPQPHSRWSIRAYLGLRAKLSQAPFSYLIIFLCVQIWRIFQQKRDVDEFAAEARESFSQECRDVERAVSSLLLYPSYAAIGASHAITATINKSFQELANVFTTFLDGIVATIRFALEILTGNWRCFLENIVAQNIPLISGLSNAGLTVIDATTNGLVDLLSGPFAGLSKLVESGLKNNKFHIPDSVLRPPEAQKVEFCSGMIDTLSLDYLTGLLNKVYDIILYCLGALILLILLWNIFSIRRGHQHWEKNVERIKKQLYLWYSIHPPEDPTAVSTHDSGPSKQEQDEDGKPSGSSQDPSKQEIAIGETHAPIEEVAARLARLISNPLLFGPVEYLLQRYASNHPRRQARLLWFLEYVSQRAAVVCLKIGVLGLILVQFKLLALQKVREDTLDTLLRESGVVLTEVTRRISATSNATSVLMATSINHAILISEQDINFRVTLPIMNATWALSQGIGTVESTVTQGLQSAFGQNLISTAVQASIQCLFLNKLARVQRGIAEIEKHLIIALPRVEPSMFVVNQTLIEEAINKGVGDLTTPPPSGGNSTAQDPANTPLGVKIRRAVDHMLDKIERDLYSERILYIGLAAVWGFLLLVATVTILFAPVTPIRQW